MVQKSSPLPEIRVIITIKSCDIKLTNLYRGEIWSDLAIIPTLT